MPHPIQDRLALAIIGLGERTTRALAHVSYVATLAALRASRVATHLQLRVVDATARASTAVRKLDLRAELGHREPCGEHPRGRAEVTIVPPAGPSTVDGLPEWLSSKYDRVYPMATLAYGRCPPGLAVVGDAYDGVEIIRVERVAGHTRVCAPEKVSG